LFGAGKKSIKNGRESVKGEITRQRNKKAICNFCWFEVKLVTHMQGGH
jgi:hypothetical protein